MDSNSELKNGFINTQQKISTNRPNKIALIQVSGESRTPAFLTKKEVYEWIKTRRKTIELRRGKPQNGDNITFLNGRNESVRGRILRKQAGTLFDVLNLVTYKKIIPTAETLDDAMAFVKQIYPSTEGMFTTYEFDLEQK